MMAKNISTIYSGVVWQSENTVKIFCTNILRSVQSTRNFLVAYIHNYYATQIVNIIRYFISSFDKYTVSYKSTFVNQDKK